MEKNINRGKKIIAAALGAALILLSPGYPCYAQLAKTVSAPSGRSLPVSPIPQLRGLSSPLGGSSARFAAPLSAPSLPNFSPARMAVLGAVEARSEGFSAPGIYVPGTEIAPAVGAQEALRQGVETIEAARTDSAQERGVAQIYEGRAFESADWSLSLPGAEGPAAGAVSAPDLAPKSVSDLQASASDSKTPEADRRSAVAALAKKDSDEARAALEAVGTSNPEGGATDYEIKRAALKALAEQGKVVSLPAVSRAHADEILAKLRAEKPDAAVFDYDGTLEEYQTQAAADTGAALKSVADAGIETMILTDRPSVGRRDKSESILYSIENFKPEEKAAITVGSNRGAEIALFNAKAGKWETIREEPGWSDVEQKAVAEASAEVGRQFGTQEYKGKTENISPYGYARFLPIGLPEEQVKAAARLFQSELDKRGIKLEVLGRTASKATDPPYLSTSKIDKALGIGLLRANRAHWNRLRDVLKFGLGRWLSPLGRLLGRLPADPIAAKSMVVVGDHFFGTKIVDAPMVKGAPGALALSVGALADPRLENVFVWPAKGKAATQEIMGALAARAPPGAGGLQKGPLTAQFVQGFFSISAFILTSIAYPFIAIPAVGPAAFGALMAFGPLAAIATGPLNGMIAKKLSARNAMAFNMAIRAVLALALPAFAALGILNFWTLLIASIFNGWLMSSVMTTENIYLRRFAGPKHIGTATALFWMRYLFLQVVLGLLIGVGAFIDQWNPMTPFYISAAVHAFIILPITWKFIPNVIDKGPATAPEATPATKGRAALLLEAAGKSLKSKGEKVGAFARKYWKEALIFAAALGSYFIWTSALPAAIALAYWISKTGGFKELWARKDLRWAVAFSCLMAFLVFPLQYYSMPFMAKIIAGEAGKALLLGQLLGALFFGQLISNAGQAKLPKLRLPVIGRFGAERLLQAGVLGLLAAWVYNGLIPAAFIASAPLLALGIAAAAALGGGILMALAGKLTNKGWVKLQILALPFVALPALFWGNIPVLFGSILMIGMFFGPLTVALSGYFYKNVPSKGAESLIGVQGSFFNAAISVGYGVVSLAAGLFTPAFPALLIPMGVAFTAAGIALLFAPKLIGLTGPILNKKEPKK